MSLGLFVELTGSCELEHFDEVYLKEMLSGIIEFLQGILIGAPANYIRGQKCRLLQSLLCTVKKTGVFRCKGDI